ncbi:MULTISPECIES: transglycosylase domain-containing protein [unclassified Paracoccus (in: a-proteobacteria)]|uniref:transglycosylase domain-containing protein n=1 Tax=unclassified Paracoccus (in: a-proteobacteria) TaxID=2688777 RepID=UPI001601AE6B|nr:MULTISPECIES: PBP1A family penicillin-binding protein [unclassified Paracoccus (in: a-proteobacteria)]MBB1490121.1 PBP1A family penicillin-binding protein [Paracoccus sp. MC1854]MBB1496709.1 PBP1A family penicillin-binding protein [Paracoccus sp. MC1862]QQO43718.1 PBP1A family penicillin-binding protein [Paracoccus sp. MC1862]
MKKPDKPRRLAADRRYAAPSDAQAPSGGGLPPQQAQRRAPPKRPARRGNFVTRGVAGTVSLFWRVVWGSFWRTGATLALILGLTVAYYYSTLPDPQALFDGRARGSVTMLDRDGRVFAWRGETYNTTSGDQIAPVLRNAVVATEDKRFFSHLGVDPRGIASAIRINMSEGRGPLEGNGGSTITQQVSKLLCLGEEFDPIKWKSEAEYEADCRKSSLWRKVKEVPYSLAMEARYSKDDILNIYMNRSYLGAGARGFEAAAQRYFGKSAAEVNAAEAAMLAGLLKAPSYFAPTSNLQRSQDRANLILGLMHEQGYLDDVQLTEARANPAVLSRAAAARAGGYFADWVMESGPGFLTSETTEDVTITTTFDQTVQRQAERALKRIFDEKVKDGSKAQAAVVVMSADGAVRAMIGGRETTTVGTFNRATQAKRQTGSAFKPFVFAAALDQGYSPNDTILDAPITIHIKGSKPWTPKNYTRNHMGEITLTTAISKSINTSTIRLQEAVGRDNVRRVARDFGFANDIMASPSMGLGVAETTLLEMTGAYAGIRNGGTAVRPYGLIELRIKGNDNPLIGQIGGMGQRVISPKAASELIWMMQQAVENGTGGRAKLPGREVAGKTGTTSSYRDAWFIGFTEQYVTGVWMGYDDNTPLQGVTGGGLPAEIWQAVMAEIHEGLPANPLGVIAPDGAGNLIVASDIVSADADDPLAAALAQAVAAAQPVDGRVADVALPGDATGMPVDAAPIVTTSPDGSVDPLAAALAEAMGQPEPAPEPVFFAEPAPSAPPPAPVPAPVPVRSGPITEAGDNPAPPSEPAPSPPPRTAAATVSSSDRPSGAPGNVAIEAAVAEAGASPPAPADLASDASADDALMQALRGIPGLN